VICFSPGALDCRNKKHLSRLLSSANLIRHDHSLFIGILSFSVFCNRYADAERNVIRVTSSGGMVEYGVDPTSIDSGKLRWCTHVIWNFPSSAVEDDCDSNAALLVAFFNGLTASILGWKLPFNTVNSTAPMVHMLLQVCGLYNSSHLDPCQIYNKSCRDNIRNVTTYVSWA
jgi:hypothetical protein